MTGKNRFLVSPRILPPLDPDFKPADLAKSIGMKLVCTFLGLCVAIPALSAYGTLRNRIDTLTAEAIGTAREMLGVLRRAKKPE